MLIDDSLKMMELIGAKKVEFGFRPEAEYLKHAIQIIEDWIYITEFETLTLDGNIRVVESRSDEFFSVKSEVPK